jgi:hypothetical protein
MGRSPAPRRCLRARCGRRPRPETKPVLDLIGESLTLEIATTEGGRVVSAELAHAVDPELLRRLSAQEHVKVVRVEPGSVRSD